MDWIDQLCRDVTSLAHARLKEHGVSGPAQIAMIAGAEVAETIRRRVHTGTTGRTDAAGVCAGCGRPYAPPAAAP